MASFLESQLALPLKNKTYGIYVAGNGISLIGTWMQRISVSWLTWELTHSGLWLGIITFAEFFPGLVVGPLAGAVADRTNQLNLVKISQVVLLVQAMVLFALTAADHLNVGGLVALIGFQGTIVSFNQPARLALVPSLVAEADVGSAVAINSVIFNLARFIGPMLAGLVIVRSGVAAAFAANAVSYAAFLLALFRVKIDAVERAPGGRRNFSTDLKAGIRYTAGHPAIASLLVLLTAIGIGGRPLNQLLPGFAAQVFHLGAGGFSILASAAGAGAILGGLWLGHRSQSLDLVFVATMSALGGAVAAICVSATGTMWVGVPGIAAFGFCLSVAGIAIQTVIQLASDRAMRGRVMGLYGVLFRSAPALGTLAAGLASVHFGLRWPVIFGALIVIAVAGCTYARQARVAAGAE
jgi:predicted MFS family arabinose efflux permease